MTRKPASRQPQLATTLRGHRRWALVHNHALKPFGYANVTTTYNGTATTKVSANGAALSIVAANSDSLSYGVNTALQLSTCSGVALLRVPTLSVGYTLFNTDFTASAGGLAIYIASTGKVTLTKINTADMLISSNSVVAGRDIGIAWSYNATTGRARLAVNGVLTSGTSIQTVTHGTFARGRFNSTSASYSGAHDQYLFAISASENFADKQLIEDSLNPWGLFVGYNPYIPAVPGAPPIVYHFSGNITESSPITDWRISAHKSSDGSLAATSVVSGTTYDISLATPIVCNLTISPKIDYLWSAGKIAALNDYVGAVSPDTTPHLFKVTTAGTFDVTEPTYNTTPGATTTSGTATLTCVGPLVDPKTIGPKAPYPV